MKKLHGAVFVGVVALLALHRSCRPPQDEPAHDVWQEMMDALDAQGAAIDEKFAGWGRFKAVHDKVDRAIIHDGLPLYEAAATLVAAAHRHYPQYLDAAHAFAGNGLCRDDFANVARLLVQIYRDEFHHRGNHDDLDPKLLERLEREFAEMSIDAAR
ncbi:MAG: hypothetical protein L0Y71_21610 [Gemmataceae bacterium]|nr:hypothetical protein [Gemmataceae bacterium]